MRELVIQTARGNGCAVLKAARDCHAVNAYVLTDADGANDMTHVHIPNRYVEPFVARLEGLAYVRLAFMPSGVLTLEPPHEHVSRTVTDVTERSPLEVFLGGLQSVGSWTGFLGYAGAAGVVVWIGLLTNTMYLLVGAMLIAPFAGPAMNAALATARGDGPLLGRSLLRYSASLALTIAVAAVLSLAFRQQTATDLMVQVSQLSSVAVLLPLVAGGAGALNLVQSERNSLVSGAAVGMLVAASLAPPAGLIGMAAVVREWEMAVSGLLLLLMQLVGINLAGAAVFRWYGISPSGARYARGHAWIARVGAAGGIAALAGLLVWQFVDPPAFQRSTKAERALEQIKQVVNQSGMALLAEGNVRYTRADIKGQPTLLAVLYVQRADEGLSKQDIQERLADAIATRLHDRGFDVTPLLDITVLSPPPPEPIMP